MLRKEENEVAFDIIFIVIFFQISMQTYFDVIKTQNRNNIF